MKTLKLTFTPYIVASVLALAIASAPFVGLANDDGDRANPVKFNIEDKIEQKGNLNAGLKAFKADADINAKFEAKLEKKLDNPNSNSIWKRLAGFFKNEKENRPRTDLGVAVVISNASALSERPHQATLTWTTDVRANSLVWYGTAAGISTSGDANVARRGKVLNHKVILGRLEANTKYYVVVGSMNKEGKLTVSAETSFTTPAAPVDTVAPVIRNVGISAVTANSAKISWNTSEPSDSKVFYSKITPIALDASTTASVSADAKVTNHALNLTGLEANTVYYFKAQSTDGANNVSLTGTGAFMTAVGQ